jgi:hypothetical protein
VIAVKTNPKYDFAQDAKKCAKRQYEIEENERIGVRLRNKLTGEESEIIAFFMLGVLTITWEQGAKIN